MSDQPGRSTSIRRRLLVFLISSLLLMVSGAAVVTYWVAKYTVTDAYDRSLLDPVFDIADNVRIDSGGAHVDLPRKALEALIYDKTDNVMFQIRSPENEIIDGAVDLPPPPPMASGQHVFFDGTYGGERIRVAALRTANGFVIQVGETLHKRNRLVAEILIAELVPTLLIALAAIALALVGVAHGLKPLEYLRTELLGRAPRDLRPLSETSAPVEIAPLVRAFNGLLARLRAANTMQQRFLANAAHQLRTPLAGLQMHLELLLRRELPSDIRAQIERMHTATVRSTRLANQLLALAKAETPPDYRRDLRILDLKSLADAAARDWAPRALARKIDLGFSLGHAPIQGDPLLLPELIDNLIDNALRYTPAGGAVTVNTGSEAQSSYLSVEDTGPGIPADERTRVRERFYRVAGTPGEGSGLGLAIAQEVVDRHAGVLEIDSRDGSGSGTRIRVSFPRSYAAAAQPA
ncbi:MAG TPA: sensor histidine kinase [Casimicrobiaceae bacterium]|nr:sensor histidine kinase [Casimicrobiaceae bacterium]